MILKDWFFYLWKYAAKLRDCGFEGWLLHDFVNTQIAFEKKFENYYFKEN